MEVILLQNISTLGKKGEIKIVNNGYARNYLIPNHLATIPTPALIHQYKQEAIRKNKKQEKSKINSEKLAHILENQKIVIIEKSNDDGTLFSGIDNRKVAKEIQRTTGKEIKEKNIVMEKPIKKVGLHEIKVILNDKQYSITLNIKGNDN